MTQRTKGAMSVKLTSAGLLEKSLWKHVLRGKHGRIEKGNKRRIRYSINWFEGYTYRMWEAELITEGERDYAIEKISEMFQDCCTNIIANTG